MRGAASGSQGRGIALIFALLLAATMILAVPLLSGARQTARAALNDAVELRDWVAAEVKTLPITNAADPAQPHIGPTALDATVIAAGLRNNLMTREALGDGRIALAFRNVAFAEFTPWLATATRDGALRITALRLDAAGPGRVDAGLTLAPSR